MSALSKAQIASRIKARRRKGLSLRSSRVRKEDPSLFRSAKVQFGKVEFWRKAIESAGISYQSVRGKRDWRTRKARLEAIREAVQAKARKTHLLEPEAARKFTSTAFRAAGLGAMLAMYYEGSPKKAIQAAYGIDQFYSMKGEFDSWREVRRHLRRCLKEEDCGRLTESRFCRIVPGAHKIVKRFGPFLSLMDRAGLRPIDPFKHEVPRDHWRHKKNKVRCVTELVRRFRRRRKDRGALPTHTDFTKRRLGGLLASTGMTATQLLREAGFPAAAPKSWKSKAVRVRRTREIVDGSGGPDQTTISALIRVEAGLVDWYQNSAGTRKARGNVSLLYVVLCEAGYAVTAEQCERGMSGRHRTVSHHGHSCDSRVEALIDDWVFDIVGQCHEHAQEYPGQRDKKGQGGRFNCDFLLHPGARDKAQSRCLWLEFAGLKSAPGVRGKKYRRSLKAKKRLARKAKLKWLAVTPAQFRRAPMKVWREMMRLAPWLKSREVVALESRYWKALKSLRGEDAIAYAVTRRKHTTQALLRALKDRIAAGEPMNIQACSNDPAFGRFFQAIKRHPSTEKGPGWWEKWLTKAGMSKKQAAATALRKWHQIDRDSVRKELVQVYRRALKAGTWPGNEPPLNGALQRRAKKTFGTVPEARRAAIGDDVKLRRMSKRR